MKKTHRQPAGRRGFTIIELLVYSGILVSFLYVMTNMFIAILDTQLESESNSAVVTDSRYLLSRLTYDIERADALLVPADLGAQADSLVLRIDGTDVTYAITNG